eukprot:CAMPEP_0198303998 /NCGR_PEP_ID=MMETSP1449-20131203/57176_1 /TAXON_ID=420275 /ORGANISM="Attheya septentrionalis, Strain CCMP2084" /LENGTH=717 /DNA_ID=CAMNT_0044006509 /DNA_START=167 /DNA_END=2321 /DNA_ORIENTATION=+
MEDRNSSSVPVVPEDGDRLPGKVEANELSRVMEEAHLAGHDQVGRWMWSVLHEAACRTLRRILLVGSMDHSSRRRSSSGRSNTDSSNSSGDSVLDGDLRVEPWHVSACDEFARRIGQAWAQHLEASGYNELSLLLHHYLEATNDPNTHIRHSFLEEEPPALDLPEILQQQQQQQHDLQTIVGNETARDDVTTSTVEDLDDPNPANKSQNNSNHIVPSRHKEDSQLLISSSQSKKVTLWSKLNQLGCQDGSSYVPTKSNRIETGTMHPVFQPNLVGDRTAAIVGNETARDDVTTTTGVDLDDPNRANKSQNKSNHIVISRREEDSQLLISSSQSKKVTLWSKLNQLGCQDGSSYVPTKSNRIETGTMHPVFQPNLVGDRTAAIRAWTKQQIEQLDHDMIPKEKIHGYGMWPYPSTSIQKAVQRNKKRISLESSSGSKFSTDYEVIPKSMILQSAATTSQSEDEPSEEQQLWNVTNSEAFRRYKRKRASDHPTTAEQNIQRQIEDHVNTRQIIKGRSPSSIGHEQWSSEEIAADLGTDEDRQSLLRACIHEEVPEDTHEEPVHVVRGALKHLGLVHAWAQRRQRQLPQGDMVVDKDDDYNKEEDDRYGFDLNNVVHNRHTQNKDASTKRQLRLYRKARKERLFPHVADMDHKESTRRASKIARASASNEHDGTKEWLELDLGECVLEVMESPDEGHQPSRKLYSFSSLEVSLLDADEKE